MDGIMNIVYAILVLGIMGAVFGAILAFAAKIFHVEQDPRIDEVRAADGKLLLRIKFKHSDDGSYSAGRLAYRADENMQSFYAAKSAQPRSRGRRRRRAKVSKQQERKGQ